MSVEVECIHNWMETWTGFREHPRREEDWGSIVKERIDGGIKVWRIRLAEELFGVWQHGEYNFVQRVAKRDDPLAKTICIGEFVDGVMRTVLLLSRDYTPYWKWLAHEFRERDAVGTSAFSAAMISHTGSIRNLMLLAK